MAAIIASFYELRAKHTAAATNIKILTIRHKSINGIVKQQFLHLAVKSPITPVMQARSPATRANAAPTAVGDGYFLSPISQVS